MKTVRELREGRGWTPVELAAALHVSLATIYNWESDKHEPRASQLRDIAQVFGVSMDDIKIPGVRSDAPGRAQGAGDTSPLRRK